MSNSWRIGRIAGIDIFIHWTFLLLIAFLLFLHLRNGEDFAMAARGIAFTLSIFGCVVLHELGHALAARRFHIRTRDITLLPIGGVARLERMPQKPLQELWVAVAGPLVNVAIAALLLGVLYAAHETTFWSKVDLAGTDQEAVNRSIVRGSFLADLLAVNIMLVVFNMLPAFPMDGGRVLRALLATRLDYVRATNIAAGIGQLMAMVFGFIGLFYNPMLMFVAFFVYIGAKEEAQAVTMRSLFRGVPTRAAMMTRFRTLRPSDSLSTAVAELLAGSQTDFPVVDDTRQIVGLLTRNDLFRTLSEGSTQGSIAEAMRPVCYEADVDDMLDTTMRRMREANCPTATVMQHGELVGLITLENIGEFLSVQTALQDLRRHHSTNSSVV